MTRALVLPSVLLPFLACVADVVPSDATEPSWPDLATGDTPTPIAFTEFCSRTEAAQRALFNRCLPGLRDSDYDLLETGWVDRPALDLRPCRWDRPREGLVAFDGIAAARCVLGLESLDCGAVSPDLVDTCWSVFGEGTLPPGSPCLSNRECRDGSCATTGCRICEATVPQTSLDAGGCASGDCEPTALPEGHTCDPSRIQAGLDACASAGGGWVSVRCDPAGGRNRCTRLGVLGDACDEDRDCARCYGCHSSRCAVLARHGDPCEIDRDCLHGSCGSPSNPQPGPMTCVEPGRGLFEGDRCDLSCKDPELHCDWYTFTCLKPIAPGETCDLTQPLRCLTDQCLQPSDAGESPACAPLKPDGEPCSPYLGGRDCASGSCVSKQLSGPAFTSICATCPSL